MTDEAFTPELVAPTECKFPGGLGCGATYLMPIADVVYAAVHRTPITCPECGVAFMLANGLAALGPVRFYDRAAWDAWDDTVPDTEPDHYHVDTSSVELDLAAVHPAYTPSPN